MNNQNKKREKISQVGSHRETYFDYVGREAVERGGRGAGAKGVVHEILRRDNLNCSVKARVEGKVTSLTKSNTAGCVDLVTTRAGKVCGREQLKDVVSSSSMRDIRNRAANGDYGSAKMVGTRETSRIFNKTSGGGKQMTSSGISSKTTTRIADNAGAKVRNKSLLSGNMKDVGNQAAASGALAGAFGVVSSAVNDFGKLRDGHISGGEYAAGITVSGIKTGATSAVKSAAALGMKEGAKQVAKKTGQESLKRLAGSNAATAVAFAAVDQVLDTAKLFNGDISGKEYTKKSISTAASAYGGFEGAAIGATIGSAVPVVGTAVGAVVGGIIGSIGGGVIGDFFGGLFD